MDDLRGRKFSANCNFWVNDSFTIIEVTAYSQTFESKSDIFIAQRSQEVPFLLISYCNLLFLLTCIKTVKKASFWHSFRTRCQSSRWTFLLLLLQGSKWADISVTDSESYRPFKMHSLDWAPNFITVWLIVSDGDQPQSTITDSTTKNRASQALETMQLTWGESERCCSIEFGFIVLALCCL